MINASPRSVARAAGVLYLLVLLSGIMVTVVGRTNETWYLLISFMGDALYITATILLYLLFEPVNRALSMLSAFFGVTAMTIGILSLLRLASSPVHNLVFLGAQGLLLGCLILRSTLIPRMLGWAKIVAGIGWLTFLWPTLGNRIFRYTMISGFLLDGALTLWLVVKGVDAASWRHQAGPHKRSARVVPAI